MILIALYLAAILMANLVITVWGPAASIVTAFLLIGLDLTVRDGLHEAWKGRGLWWKMALLIGSGSMLSWILNRNAGSIALASFVAFAAAGAVDALTYHSLHRHERFFKVNGSNAVSALIDSLIFPTLAFGGLLPGIVAGQFAAKVAGGFLWALLLRRLLWTKTSGTL